MREQFKELHAIRQIYSRDHRGEYPIFRNFIRIGIFFRL